MPATPRRKGLAYNSNKNSGGDKNQHGNRERPHHRPSTLRASTQAQEASSPSLQWPVSLRDYIARSFDGHDDKEHENIRKELRSIISEAVKAGVHWSLKWERMPLPYVVLAQKEAKANRIREESDNVDLELSKKEPKSQQRSMSTSSSLGDPITSIKGADKNNSSTALPSVPVKMEYVSPKTEDGADLDRMVGEFPPILGSSTLMMRVGDPIIKAETAS